MALLLSLYGCTTGDNEKKITSDNSLKEEIENKEDNSNDSIDDKKGVKEDEVTIAIWDPYYWELQIKFPMLRGELAKIKEKTGINIRYDVIEAENQQEFIKKLNTKLYLDKGPTLIYFYNMPTKIYTESGVALKLKGKVENLENVYDSIRDKNDYFIPIGMETYFIEMNGYESSELEIEEPDFNWNWDDYRTIRDKWLEENGRVLKSYLMRQIYYHKIDQLNVIDIKEKEAKINTEEVKTALKDLRNEFLSGKYELPSNFEQEYYYKACFDINNLSDEERYGKYSRFISLPANDIFECTGENGLYTSTLHKKIRKNKIVLPYVPDRDKSLHLTGFLINRNGKNIDNAIEFLNYILSDKAQMELYSTFKKLEMRFYPVNKNIEDKIKEIEKNGDLDKKVLKLKEYELERIKNGENKPNRVYKEENIKIFTLKDKLYKDIFKLIFSDEEYSDSKLERKLQELENQYNIYLNE